MEQKEKVAAYIRTSSDKQDASQQEQFEFIKTYCDRRGWEVVWRAHDEISGYEDEDRRNGFNRLLKEQERHGFTKIVVWKSDRAFRNAEVSMRVRRTLGLNGCRIFGVADPVEDDGSAEAKLVLGMTAVASEHYRNNLSDRVKASHRFKTSKGLHQGGIAPFGYVSVPDKHVIGNVKYAMWEPDRDVFADRQICEWVVWIFEEFVRCRNATTIALALNEAGVPSPGYLNRWLRIDELERERRSEKAQSKAERGEKVREYPPSNAWDPSVISTVILRSRAYLGEISYTEGQGKNNSRRAPKQKTWCIGLQEPIISQQLFNQVQDLLDARAKDHRKPADKAADVLLGGMIICGRCGKAVSRIAKNESQRKYLCNRSRTTRGTECQEPRYNSRTVDDAAASLLVRGIKLRRIQIVQALKDEPQKGVNTIATELESLEQEKERLKIMFRRGYLTETELDGDMAPILTRINDLKSKQVERESSPSLEELDRVVTNIQACWSEFPMEQKRLIIQTYVPKGFALADGLLKANVCGVPLEAEIRPLPPPTKGIRYGGRKSQPKTPKTPESTDVSGNKVAPTHCGGVTKETTPAAPTEGNERPSLGTVF